MEQMPFTYERDIQPHMPQSTKISSEKGALVLAQLSQVSFDRQSPQWKFEDAFEWARDNLNKPGSQVDLAILKRFVALHIDRSENQKLDAIKDGILASAQDKRWVVLANVGGSVPDERVEERWNQFIEKLILYAPILSIPGGDLLEP